MTISQAVADSVKRFHDAAVQDMLPILHTFTGLEEDEHGANTPSRFLNMLDELTQCKDPSDEHLVNCIKWAQFTKESDEMIGITNIPFVSVCNHHVIPFIGVAHVAYVPNEDIAGLSKIARTVQHYARQLQLQERLTRQVAEHITGKLNPLGVAVVLQAEHMCMTIRGVQVPGTLTTTSSMTGVFADHARTAKAEFMQLIASAK